MKQSTVLAGLAISLVALAASQPSAEEIIQKSVIAQGGADKIKSVKTLQLTGKALIGGKVEAPITYRAKRPTRYRTDFTIDGHHLSEGFDGTVNWQSDGTTPVKFPDENAKRAANTADPIGSPLFNYKEKGNSYEYQGQETVDGEGCYKFKVKMKSGDTSLVYIHQKSFLTFRTITTAGELVAESRLNDYRLVDGVSLPFSNTVMVKGKEIIKFQYDKAELNVPLDDSLFTMPAKK